MSRASAANTRVKYGAPLTWRFVLGLRRLEELRVHPAKALSLASFFLRLVLVVGVVVVLEHWAEHRWGSLIEPLGGWARLFALIALAVVLHGVFEAIVHHALHELANGVVSAVAKVSPKVANNPNLDRLVVGAFFFSPIILILIALAVLRVGNPAINAIGGMVVGVVATIAYQRAYGEVKVTRDQGEIVETIRGDVHWRYEFRSALASSPAIPAAIAKFAFGVRGPNGSGITRDAYMARLFAANPSVFAVLFCRVSRRRRSDSGFVVQREVAVGYVSVIPLVDEVIPWYLGDPEVLTRYANAPDDLRRNQVSQFTFGDREILPVGAMAKAVYFQAVVDLNRYRWHTLRIPGCSSRLVEAGIRVARGYGEFGSQITRAFAEGTTADGIRLIASEMHGKAAMRSGNQLFSREGHPIYEVDFSGGVARDVLKVWNARPVLS